MRRHQGLHPRIGALDVCPVVWLDAADREAAARGRARGRRADRARSASRSSSTASSPTGERAPRARLLPRRRPRRALRGGWRAASWRPTSARPSRTRAPGATLVTARPPLAAFNVELDTRRRRGRARGRRRAARVGRRPARGAGDRPAARDGPRARSRPTSTTRRGPAGARRRARSRELAAPHGARPVEAELVGLVPEAALAGYPEDLPIRGFDPAEHVIERRLGEPATD